MRPATLLPSQRSAPARLTAPPSCLPALPCPPRRTAAAALQYGIERDFTNHSETVVLYDLGASSLQAALVSYSAYTNAKVGVWVVCGGGRVRRCVWWRGWVGGEVHGGGGGRGGERLWG